MSHLDGSAAFLTQSRAQTSLRREFDAIGAELELHIHEDGSVPDRSTVLTVLPNRITARLGTAGVSFSWVPGRSDRVEDGRLLVIEWRGVLGAQRGNGSFASAAPSRERIYRPEATEPANWRWRDDQANGLACTTATLVGEWVASARVEAGEPEG